MKFSHSKLTNAVISPIAELIFNDAYGGSKMMYNIADVIHKQER